MIDRFVLLTCMHLLYHPINHVDIVVQLFFLLYKVWNWFTCQLKHVSFSPTSNAFLLLNFPVRYRYKQLILCHASSVYYAIRNVYSKNRLCFLLMETVLLYKVDFVQCVHAKCCDFVLFLSFTTIFYRCWRYQDI